MSIEDIRAQAAALTADLFERLAKSEAQDLADYITRNPDDLDGMVSRLDELKFDIRRWQNEVRIF